MGESGSPERRGTANVHRNVAGELHQRPRSSMREHELPSLSCRGNALERTRHFAQRQLQVQTLVSFFVEWFHECQLNLCSAGFPSLGCVSFKKLHTSEHYLFPSVLKGTRTQQQAPSWALPSCLRESGPSQSYSCAYFEACERTWQTGEVHFTFRLCYRVGSLTVCGGECER